MKQQQRIIRPPTFGRAMTTTTALLVVVVGLLSSSVVRAFAPPAHCRVGGTTTLRLSATAQQQQEQKQDVQAGIAKLKKVLQREYTSFFDPMEREYYTQDVKFLDPLNSLSGIDAFQNNVDMLGGRTWLGRLLFSGAKINLHSIQGGQVTMDDHDQVSISDLTTRWTMRFCFSILPWKPTARFSGISVYRVIPGGTEGVLIAQQNDYWDSINLLPDGSYQEVDKSIGLADFVSQLAPHDDDSFLNAPAAAPELPYELLRRGNGYEVRRYPSFTAAQLVYQRRDEGYSALGAFTKGMNPLAPAILRVTPDEKTMMWPLSFAAPGQEASLPNVPPKMEGSSVQVVTQPSSVVAVGRFSDASVEPVVQKAARALSTACQRDGLVLDESEEDVLQFCQYDAIFSMGKRRGEVWIPLKQHPWSQ